MNALLGTGAEIMDRNDRAAVEPAIDNETQSNRVEALMLEIRLRRRMSRDMQHVAVLLQKLSDLMTDEEFTDFCQRG